MPRAADLPCVAVRRLSEAVNKSWSSWVLCRTFGARRVWPFYPGLTAGPTYCRLFEAGSPVTARRILRAISCTDASNKTGSWGLCVPAYCRRFEAGSEVVAKLVPRSNGRQTRREAPQVSSLARKRVVS